MMDVVWLALRLGMAAILVVSAAGKLRRPTRFAEDIGRYRLLPSALLVPVAWSLTVAEIAVAALLLAGVEAGFWLATALFVLFAAAVGSALGRRLAIPCGCFGGDDAISAVALARVGLLVVASVAGIVLGLTSPARIVGGWDLPMAATIAVGGLILGRLLLLVPDVRSALGFGSAVPDDVAPSREMS